MCLFVYFDVRLEHGCTLFSKSDLPLVLVVGIQSDSTCD